MAQLPENIKNMWFNAAKEPVTISEPTNYTKNSAIDSLIEKIETENEALFLVIEDLLDRLVTEDVEILAGVKVPKRSTRKHMKEVAARIASLRPEERGRHHKQAAAYFARSNPRFNHEKFRKACGISDGMEQSDYVKEAKHDSYHNSYEDCVQFYIGAHEWSPEAARKECGQQKTRGNIKEQ
ncbi:MAG: hypothetical protein EB127_02965 [Alphaproteobacteria bacterium]|nr:hypothetical protein [Alphaproteobacteria bacterium]